MLTAYRFLLDNNPAPVVEDLHLEEGPPALDLEMGQLYLYKPSEEEKQADPGVPFYLVKIKRKEGLSGRQVRVQFWEVDRAPDCIKYLADGRIDYFQSAWGARERDKDGTIMSRLQLYEADDERFIAKVSMRKKTTKTYPAYMYAKDQGKVRYWTDIWLGGADHDVAFEDIID